MTFAPETRDFLFVPAGPEQHELHGDGGECAQLLHQGALRTEGRFRLRETECCALLVILKRKQLRKMSFMAQREPFSQHRNPGVCAGVCRVSFPW